MRNGKRGTVSGELFFFSRNDVPLFLRTEGCCQTLLSSNLTSLERREALEAAGGGGSVGTMTGTGISPTGLLAAMTGEVSTGPPTNGDVAGKWLATIGIQHCCWPVSGDWSVNKDIVTTIDNIKIVEAIENISVKYLCNTWLGCTELLIALLITHLME